MITQYDRSPEIAFSGHQNAENEQWNTREIGTELTIRLKLRFVTFVRLNVLSNHHGKIRHCRLNTSITIINFQTPKSLLYCLISQNDRSTEIAYSGHQNAEN